MEHKFEITLRILYQNTIIGAHVSLPTSTSMTLALGWYINVADILW